jgi:multidrug resistance efflux pump
MRAIAIALILISASRSAIPAEPSLRPPLRIDVVQLRLIEHSEVSALEEGALHEMAVREGDLVKEDALLARLEDSESRLARDRAEIEYRIATENAQNDVRVRLAEKSLEVARAELKRAEESRQKYSGSVSDTELDRLRLLVDRGELEYEQAQLDQKTAGLNCELKKNDLDLAQHRVERREIVAPLTGVVVQINLRKGEWVRPGESVMRLVRMDRLRAEGFLESADLTDDPTGRPVTLVVDLPGQTDGEFTGTIQFVSPEVNPVNGQVRFWAQIDNKNGRLRPGMEASLVIRPSE